MKPLKCYLLATWCLWNGHEGVEGTVYVTALGKRLPCICCKHCYKVLGPL